ncbi:saccharopine dehydrogenase family protein [Silanimonas sp.]|jgi:saccharopine dehydrogenase-like NADP-dependent oxidoreductase|uniref:saccharopine dehydrogenase family protein n=1 Tax=Silanimonas sp. TaxID=1929290 RepID=UPI0037CC490C
MRVLLIGAAGQFGSRIASVLAGDPRIALILVGRRRDTLEALASALRRPDGGASSAAARSIEIAVVDVDAPDLAARLRALSPALVIHTAGPFQRRDYRVARACLAVGAHYLDLADARAFVGGIAALDADAKAAGCWVVSGASSVPALSSAVVAAFEPRFARMQRVVSAIAPGNRTDRGLATTRAILGYVGQPFRSLVDGQWRNVHGWQSLRRWDADALGTRWLARCDVPDLDLLPARWPTLMHCEFRAGLELRRMHHGLWLASWAVRAGLLRDLSVFAELLLGLSRVWQDGGSDRGGMRVVIEGEGRDGRPLRIDWQLVAGSGHGPQVPATAAVILARRLAAGTWPGAGALPCVDVPRLDEFDAAWAGFDIHTSVVETHD